MNNVKLSYNGLIDEAVRFVEKIQLLDRSLWEKVIAVFEYGGFEKGWHGEFWGKLMLSAVRCCRYKKDERLA